MRHNARVSAYMRAAEQEFPDLVCLGTFVPRKIAGTESWSQHAYGNAVDFSQPGWPSSLQALFDWTIAHAPEFSVAKVIFNQQVWSGNEVREYGGVHPHHDHVHVDFEPAQTGEPRGHPSLSLDRSRGEAIALGRLAVSAGLAPPAAHADVTVSGLSLEYRRVRPGDLFFCVDPNLDAARQAAEAYRRGASAVCTPRPLDLDKPELVVRDVRRAMARLSAEFFHDPARELRLLAVTGSNGKTTAAALLQSILDHAGQPAGLIGSLAARIGDRRERVPGTTPEAPTLHRLLAEMREEELTAVAMEVSSHALALGRVEGLRFVAAGFTNLSPDHLDFHSDMERYFAAKRLLFSPERCETAAVCIDDRYGRRLLTELQVPCLSFGEARDAEVRARKVHLSETGSAFQLVTPWGETRVTTSLVGRFNVSNSLAAAAIALATGIDLETVAEGLAAANPVPGRFERIDAGQPFAVVVDFARTGGALGAALRAARLLTVGEGRVIVVLGAGGEAGPEQRRQLGRVAARLGDRVLVTIDSSLSEDPEAVALQVMAGASSGREDCSLVLDRAAAIRQALEHASPGDAVIVAGRGPESSLRLFGRRIRFDDRRVARAALQTLGWSKAA